MKCNDFKKLLEEELNKVKPTKLNKWCAEKDEQRISRNHEFVVGNWVSPSWGWLSGKVQEKKKK